MDGGHSPKGPRGIWQPPEHTVLCKATRTCQWVLVTTDTDPAQERVTSHVIKGKVEGSGRYSEGCLGLVCILHWADLGFSCPLVPALVSFDLCLIVHS